MGLLDAIGGGGPLGMLPGADILSMVSKGLDVLKNLIDHNDIQGADKILDMLTRLMDNANGPQSQAPAACEPEPFQVPANQSTGDGSGSGIKLDLHFPAAAQMVSHSRLPEVDGSAQGDQNLSNAARPYVDGSDASVNRALTPGSAEWNTVVWAMQKNPNVCYDADSQRFFTKMSDGSRRDVCSLQDAENVIQQHGGFNRSNPVAPGAALDQFLTDKVSESQNAPLSSSLSIDLGRLAQSGSAGAGAAAGELNAKLDALKKKLQTFEQAHQLMAGAAHNVTVTVTT